MKRTLLLNGIISALVLLFVYASLSKLLDFDRFRDQMYNQPFPIFISDLLKWVVPIIELFCVLLLLVKRWRMSGLYLSFVLMFLFTGYVGLVVLNFFGRIPCSCGGVLQSMSWTTHLIFNIAYMILAFIGIIVTRRANDDTLNHNKLTSEKPV